MAKKTKKVRYQDDYEPRRPHIILRIVGTLIKWAFAIIGTIILVGGLTAAIVACYGAVFIRDEILPQANVDLESYTLGQDSTVYYIDTVTGEPVEMLTLDSGESRVWVDIEDMPENLLNAVVSIEDERFYQHAGVDWKRTAGAVLGLMTGNSSYGGSTITQQLIKNITKNDDVTVKRKVMEIFQALEFEKNHSKSEILEYYLNIIYLGQHSYGVGAAAQAYFGKEVSELTLEECACLVGITNNPSKYDPLRTSIMTIDGEEVTHEEANKQRQETILYKMAELGYISESERDTAIETDLVFITEKEQTGEVTNTNEEFTWFVDALIYQILDDLEAAGYSEEAAELLLYSGGLSIYTTYNPTIQAKVDAIYQDRSNFNYPSYTGQNMLSGITIIDNQTGAVVALAGGVGEKEGPLVFNTATQAKRQPGSSIKPLAVYAPALDSGVITPATAVEDVPSDVIGGRLWPKNSYTGYNGLMSVSDAIRISSNGAAVSTMLKITPDYSFRFMTENLGFTTLVAHRENSAGKVFTDIQAATALGGLTDGVTVMEMTAAYSAFARDGEYIKPYLYTSIVNPSGTVILANDDEGTQAMKPSTAYYMNQMLQRVVSAGTGTAAYFNGMTIAGKTGTTNDNYDRWFCGYTPYYTAAVWTGYDRPEKLSTGTNVSTQIWRKVMSSIHEGLPNKDFSVPGETVYVSYCSVSGKRATDACVNFVGGSQVGYTAFILGDQPTGTCDVHVMVDVDPSAPIEGENGLYKLASPLCEETIQISVIDISKSDAMQRVFDALSEQHYTLQWLEEQGYSDGPEEEEEEDPEETEDPDDPDNPDDPGPTDSPQPSASPEPSTSPEPSNSPQPSTSPEPTTAPVVETTEPRIRVDEEEEEENAP